jgi:hypothetical protein
MTASHLRLCKPRLQAIASTTQNAATCVVPAAQAVAVVGRQVGDEIGSARFQRMIERKMLDYIVRISKNKTMLHSKATVLVLRERKR